MDDGDVQGDVSRPRWGRSNTAASALSRASDDKGPTAHVTNANEWKSRDGVEIFYDGDRARSGPKQGLRWAPDAVPLQRRPRKEFRRAQEEVWGSLPPSEGEAANRATHFVQTVGVYTDLYKQVEETRVPAAPHRSPTIVVNGGVNGGAIGGGAEAATAAALAEARAEMEGLLVAPPECSEKAEQHFRAWRTAFADFASDLDEHLPKLRLRAEALCDEVNSATTGVCGAESMQAFLEQFLRRRIEALRCQRLMTKQRVPRHNEKGGGGGGSSKLSIGTSRRNATFSPESAAGALAMSAAVEGALRSLDKEHQFATERLTQFGGAEDFGKLLASPAWTGSLFIALRQLLFEDVSTRPLRRFLSQVTYVNLTHRDRLWKRCLELEAVMELAKEKSPAASVPLGIGSRKRLEASLSELAPALGVSASSMHTDRGANLLHQVSVAFQGIFVKQQRRLSFQPYPLENPPKTTVNVDLSKRVSGMQHNRGQSLLATFRAGGMVAGLFGAGSGRGTFDDSGGLSESITQQPARRKTSLASGSSAGDLQARLSNMPGCRSSILQAALSGDVASSGIPGSGPGNGRAGETDDGEEEPACFLRPSHWAAAAKWRPRVEPAVAEQGVLLRASFGSLKNPLRMQRGTPTYAHELIKDALDEVDAPIRRAAAASGEGGGGGAAAAEGSPNSGDGSRWEADVDALLRAEWCFVRTGDPQGALRRLGEVSERQHGHAGGAFGEASGVGDFEPTRGGEEDRSSLPGPLVRSYFMLRHLQCREQRWQLLCLLNVFRFVQRRLMAGIALGLRPEDAAPAAAPKERSAPTGAIGRDTRSGGGLAAATAAATGRGGLGGGGEHHHGHHGHHGQHGRMQDRYWDASPQALLRAARCGALPIDSQFSPQVLDREELQYMNEDLLGVFDVEGRRVLHEAALEDLAALEREMLSIGSFYVHKFEASAATSSSSSSSAPTSGAPGSAADGGGGGGSSSAGLDQGLRMLDKPVVERGGVLVDLYASEVWYNTEKCGLLETYLEIFEHTSDPVERADLAQRMVDITAERPRLNLEAEYFVDAYSASICALTQRTVLVKRMLDQQVKAEREAAKAAESSRAASASRPPSKESSPKPERSGRRRRTTKLDEETDAGTDDQAVSMSPERHRLSGVQEEARSMRSERTEKKEVESLLSHMAAARAKADSCEVVTPNLAHSHEGFSLGGLPLGKGRSEITLSPNAIPVAPGEFCASACMVWKVELILEEVVRDMTEHFRPKSPFMVTLLQRACYAVAIEMLDKVDADEEQRRHECQQFQEQVQEQLTMLQELQQHRMQQSQKAASTGRSSTPIRVAAGSATAAGILPSGIKIGGLEFHEDADLLSALAKEVSVRLTTTISAVHHTQAQRALAERQSQFLRQEERRRAVEARAAGFHRKASMESTNTHDETPSHIAAVISDPFGCPPSLAAVGGIDVSGFLHQGFGDLRRRIGSNTPTMFSMMLTHLLEHVHLRRSLVDTACEVATLEKCLKAQASIFGTRLESVRPPPPTSSSRSGPSASSSPAPGASSAPAPAADSGAAGLVPCPSQGNAWIDRSGPLLSAGIIEPSFGRLRFYSGRDLAMTCFTPNRVRELRAIFQHELAYRGYLLACVNSNALMLDSQVRSQGIHDVATSGPSRDSVAADPVITVLGELRETIELSGGAPTGVGDEHRRPRTAASAAQQQEARDGVDASRYSKNMRSPTDTLAVLCAASRELFDERSELLRGQIRQSEHERATRIAWLELLSCTSAIMTRQAMDLSVRIQAASASSQIREVAASLPRRISPFVRAGAGTEERKGPLLDKDGQVGSLFSIPASRACLSLRAFLGGDDLAGALRALFLEVSPPATDRREARAAAFHRSISYFDCDDGSTMSSSLGEVELAGPGAILLALLHELGLLLGLRRALAAFDGDALALLRLRRRARYRFAEIGSSSTLAASASAAGSAAAPAPGAASAGAAAAAAPAVASAEGEGGSGAAAAVAAASAAAVAAVEHAELQAMGPTEPAYEALERLCSDLVRAGRRMDLGDAASSRSPRKALWVLRTEVRAAHRELGALLSWASRDALAQGDAASAGELLRWTSAALEAPWLAAAGASSLSSSSCPPSGAASSAFAASPAVRLASLEIFADADAAASADLPDDLGASAALAGASPGAGAAIGAGGALGQSLRVRPALVGGLSPEGDPEMTTIRRNVTRYLTAVRPDEVPKHRLLGPFVSKLLGTRARWLPKDLPLEPTEEFRPPEIVPAGLPWSLPPAPPLHLDMLICRLSLKRRRRLSDLRTQLSALRSVFLELHGVGKGQLDDLVDADVEFTGTLLLIETLKELVVCSQLCVQRPSTQAELSDFQEYFEAVFGGAFRGFGSHVLGCKGGALTTGTSGEAVFITALGDEFNRKSPCTSPRAGGAVEAASRDAKEKLVEEPLEVRAMRTEMEAAYSTLRALAGQLDASLLGTALAALAREHALAAELAHRARAAKASACIVSRGSAGASVGGGAGAVRGGSAAISPAAAAAAAASAALAPSSATPSEIWAMKVDVILHALNPLRASASFVSMNPSGVDGEKAYVLKEEDLNACIEELMASSARWGDAMARSRERRSQDFLRFLRERREALRFELSLAGVDPVEAEAEPVNEEEAALARLLSTTQDQSKAEEEEAAQAAKAKKSQDAPWVVDVARAKTEAAERGCSLTLEVDRLHGIIHEVKVVASELKTRLGSEVWHDARVPVAELTSTLTAETGTLSEDHGASAHGLAQKMRLIREHVTAQFASLAAKNHSTQERAKMSRREAAALEMDSDGSDGDASPTSPTSLPSFRPSNSVNPNLGGGGGGGNASSAPSRDGQILTVSDSMFAKLAEVARRDDVRVLLLQVEELQNRQILARAFFIFKCQAMRQRFEQRMAQTRATLESNNALSQQLAQLSQDQRASSRGFASTARDMSLAEHEIEELCGQVETSSEQLTRLQNWRASKVKQLHQIEETVKKHERVGTVKVDELTQKLSEKANIVSQFQVQRQNEERALLDAAEASDKRTAEVREKLMQQRRVKDDTHEELMKLRGEIDRGGLSDEQRRQIWRARVLEVRKRVQELEEENEQLRLLTLGGYGPPEHQPSRSQTRASRAAGSSLPPLAHGGALD